MITSCLLAAALPSDCCVKFVILSIVSAIKQNSYVPELEQREGFSASASLSSFLDADAGISDRGTLLKQPCDLYCVQYFQHSGHGFMTKLMIMLRHL